MKKRDIFDVSGKTVAITGASRGIGRVLAEGFSDRGAKVYGCGSRPQSIEWMQQSPIEGRVVDVRQTDAIHLFLNEIVEKHGRLDCLINNAGIASNRPASSFSEEDMENMISTNLKGPFRACQAYYRLQRRKGGGIIINTASILGLVGIPLASVYCATKGGLVLMTRALAVEWAANDFRVNALCPGFVDTDMTEMIKKRPELYKQAVATIPMKRMASPDDMLGAALFLASDASSYMTGQTLVIDGGATAL